VGEQTDHMVVTHFDLLVVMAFVLAGVFLSMTYISLKLRSIERKTHAVVGLVIQEMGKLRR
jgi:hypothetical protein